MKFSVEDFWKTQLAAVQQITTPCSRPGWFAISQRDTSFVQADLSLRANFNDLTQPVWLIAAPGAVGKSTLAKEICAATGAVYVDLALADAVGGSYVIGGLVNNGLFEQWKAGTTTLLIDALDEARLRVTQAAFEDFLLDVVNVAKQGSLPLILIGRVGIVEECWAHLAERANFNSPIFDIELFDNTRAVEFVMASLRKLSQTSHPSLRAPLVAHLSVYRDGVEQVVQSLAATSAKDGNRFAGYAPVLEAAAKVIAGETNPAEVRPAAMRMLEGRILNKLASEILQREAKKLITQLRASVRNFPTEGVYDEDEQLGRLASRIFGVPYPAAPAKLAQLAIGPYEHAVSTFIEQHPFLDGAGKAPSGAVFGACIVAHALRSTDANLSGSAEAYARNGHHAPNPFLFDFYVNASTVIVPATHVGILYESAQAKARPGDITRLSVEGNSDTDFVELEISIGADGSEPMRYDLRTRNGETLRFGRRVAGVSVDAEGMDVEIGDGGQLEFMAPVAIEARTLLLRCNELVVKPEPSTATHANLPQREVDPTVVLEAQDFASEPGTPLITVRQGAELKVTWPGSRAYPWTNFTGQGDEAEGPETSDALRALRRLVMAFRSHSKGRLARYQGKIEHARMTKGTLGDALRQRLVDDQVLNLEGTMYYLDPKQLGTRVGLSFLDAKMKRFGPIARSYVQGL